MNKLLRVLIILTAVSAPTSASFCNTTATATFGCALPLLPCLWPCGFWTEMGPKALAAGCYCSSENNPGVCPSWLTCPRPLTGVVVGVYNLENLLTDNMCHCQCTGDDCPDNYDLPPHCPLRDWEACPW